jgi:hypothetical protein
MYGARNKTRHKNKNARKYNLPLHFDHFFSGLQHIHHIDHETHSTLRAQQANALTSCAARSMSAALSKAANMVRL